MREAWVRVSRTCQNRCVFCSDAEALTGEPVPLEEICDAIDAARGCADRVVLSGGEPTLSRHLLGAIQHAKEAGLSVALTTNGRVIQTDAIAARLKQSGLDQLRVSLHGGRRVTHDRLVGRDGAWVQTLQAVRCAARAGIEVQVQAVLNADNVGEHAYLMHLVMMAGVSSYQLRLVQTPGKPTDARGSKRPSLHDALKVVNELWVAAKEEQVRLEVVGLDHTEDAGVCVLPNQPAQADLTLLTLRRQRVAVHAASRGTCSFDVDGMTKDLGALAKAEGGLDRAGLRLAALSVALRDVPPCLDGRVDAALPPQEPQQQVGCEACPVRDACPGLTRRLTRMPGTDLRPKASWLPTPGPFRVIAADDALSQRAAEDLEHALRAAGADSAPGAGLHTEVWVGPGSGSISLPRAAATRRVDIRGGASLAEDAYLTLHGLPDAIARHPGPLPPAHAVTMHPGLVPKLTPVRPSRGSGVLLLAASADPVWLAAVAAGLGSVGGVRCLTGEVQGFAAVPADLKARLDAIRGCRLLVLAPSQNVKIEVLAEDLRWLAVAMAIGRPAASARGPGVATYVREGVSGRLTPSGEPELLRAAARELALDANRLDQLGVGARRVVAAAEPAAVAGLLLRGAPPAVLDSPSDAAWPH